MTQDVSVSPVVGVQGPARWLRQAGLVLAGTVVLTLSSYVSIPLSPVPVSMQTFAVLMVGALYGWRLGGLTVLAWLLEAALGMPVLAGGKGGLAPFFGPTGGYLFAFPVGAVLMGFGGVTAMGCTIGQGITGFSTLSLGSILAFISIVIGATATMKYEYMRMMREAG